MKKAKRAALERKGWKIGSANEFLGLSAAEAAYVEMKLALSEKLKSLFALGVSTKELGRSIS